jgi:ABC-type molybdate transport system substrate-binding protein
LASFEKEIQSRKNSNPKLALNLNADETIPYGTVAKLLAGAVDAAIVYKTDVIANSSKIRAITFADTKAASTQYKIGIAKTAIASDNRWAKRIFQYLQSTEIRLALAKAGFQVDSPK